MAKTLAPDLGWEWRKRELESVYSRVTAFDFVERVRGYPGESLTWGLYDLLGEWGEAELVPDGSRPSDAVPVATITHHLAAALATLGDDSLAGALRAIDGSRGDTRRRLAKGHRALSDGVRFFERQEVRRAGPLLAEAEAEFRRAGSPAIGWARYWSGAAALSSADFETLDRRLLPLHDEVRDAGTSPLLSGAVARTRGSAALRREQYPIAIALYLEALASFDAIGDQEASGEVRNYLADVYGFLGQSDEEWNERARSIRLLAERSPSWFSTTLSRAARSLLDSEEPAAARPFAEEALDTLERHDDPLPVDLVEAHTVLSRVEWLAGQGENARHHLDAAETALADIEDTDFAARLGADLLLYRGEYLSVANPPAAIGALGEAAEAYYRTGARFYEAKAFLLRARTRRRIGQFEAAKQDLRRGIRAHERALVAVADPLQAVSFAETWQGLFDELASILLEADADPAAALNLVDRAKDTSLRARVRHGRSTPAATTPSPAATLEVGRNLLLPSELMLAMAVIGEDELLLGWASRAADWQFLAVRPAQTLRATARAVFQDLTDGHLEPDDPRLSLLGNALLGPLAADLTASSRLILVPDRWLNQIPFSALRSRGSTEPLVADREVLLFPSVAHFVRTRRAGTNVRPGTSLADEVVAVMAPTAGVPELGLSRLFATGREARAIQEIYPKVLVAAGPAATQSALFAGLRDARVVHFAGHALAEPGNPLASRLWVSIEGQEDAARAVHGRELAEATLGRSLQLVVLSACQTSLPSRRRFVGSDGLAAIFLARGVPAVLATMWNVEDRLAAEFVVSFHRRWAGGADAAAALRQTQVEFLRSTADSRWRPSVWAAFQLAGDAVVR